MKLSFSSLVQKHDREIAENLVGQNIQLCKSSQLIANSSSRASVAISNASVSECDRKGKDYAWHPVNSRWVERRLFSL